MLEHQKEKLYIQVYEHYKELILSQRLSCGSKMPSLRKCAQQLSISRTTVESAYLQLAAEGYIIAKAQSGYYVTDIAQKHISPHINIAQKESLLRYPLSSSGVDKTSFRFDIWRRYIKSALRQDERLLTYGCPQGEPDFRQALADYVKARRNILCSPDDIVVGAGVQSLLHILCPLLKSKPCISFPTPSFLQGISIFEDYGYQIHYKDKNASVIYVTPAHMTKWGEIMPVSRRLELISHASRIGSYIIEDDFENEFVSVQKPTPAIFSLAGGQHVIYIGSFSRLLLPSIRISFMILPPGLKEAYKTISSHYNQTASKAEQIALCQFIRDGHLAAQTRKLKRLYSHKLRQLSDTLALVFGEDAQLRHGASGTSIALTLFCPVSAKLFIEQARQKGLELEILKEENSFITLLLSCSAIPTEDILPACKLLKKVWTSVQ